MKNIIKLSEASSMIARQSGRTSAIIKECTDFLCNSLHREKQVGIVVHTYAHCKPIMVAFEDRFHLEGKAEFIRFYKSEYKIVNLENYNSILFVSINSTYKLRGQRFEDFYFDTPELDLFSRENLPAICLLQETLRD